MNRLATIATMLMVASGCDKAKELAGGGARAQAAEPLPAERLDLSMRPDILFQVFGERDDPRMIPIAAILDGQLKKIVLTASGWKQFDAIYMRSGTSYPLFQDGRSFGTVQVRQGMWEKPDMPLYSLPNCTLLTPLAAVTLEATGRVGYTVEHLAATKPLTRNVGRSNVSAAEAEMISRTVGRMAAGTAGIVPALLDALTLKAVALNTGATAGATIVGAFLDAPAENRGSGDGTTTHVFVIADRTQNGEYRPTFAHSVHGSGSGAEYRRYVDRLDIDLDGVDEIILEGWRYGGDTFLTLLRFQNGRWAEIFRSRPAWCLDR